MRRVLGCVAGVLCSLGLLFAGGPLRAQVADDVFQVGTIDFFGGQGMDTAALLPKLPVRVGQTVKVDQMEQLSNSIKAAVLASSGKPSTGIEIVCCDQPGRVGLYVGVEGNSYRPGKYALAPTQKTQLPDDGFALYTQDLDALAEADKRGNSREDDSMGYALALDPTARKIELQMREYALKYGVEIERVVRSSESAEQRQAAAMLLSYGQRSPEQISVLVQAANDADNEVRNNAVRALEVLDSAEPLVGIDPSPFVAMLYSGSWSDRNKASLWFDRTTVGRDPVLLLQLRGAMAPLEDGARWQSLGHAMPFLDILGRMGGIDEVRLQKLIDSGARDEIIAAAQKH
jgi:hypothetical protein